MLNDRTTLRRPFETMSILRGLFPRMPRCKAISVLLCTFNQDFTRAIHVMTKAIAMDPSLPTPHLFSGLAWYHLAQPDAAVPELSKAVRMNPSDVMAHTWLGYAYVAQGHYSEAAGEFHTASDLEPGNLDAWYALGQSYLQLGEDASRELLAIAPDGGRVWQLAGEQFALRGEHDKAIESYQEALKRRPDLDELRQELLKLGSPPTEATSGRPANANREDACYQRAHDAEMQSRAAFQRVAEIAPDSYRAHQIIADSLLAEGRVDEAAAEYRKVLERKPDLPGVHEAIGTILRREDQLPEALHEFEQELLIQPRSASANVNAGHVLVLMGEDVRAQKSLHAALEMDRPPAEAYLLLGKLELRQNNAAAAIVSLKRYLDTTRGNSDAYYLLARAYRATGNKEEMNRALTSYKQTSQDAKQRNLAQKEVEAMSGKRAAPEETADAQPATTP